MMTIIKLKELLKQVEKFTKNYDYFIDDAPLSEVINLLTMTYYLNLLD